MKELFEGCLVPSRKDPREQCSSQSVPSNLAEVKSPSDGPESIQKGTHPSVHSPSLAEVTEMAGGGKRVRWLYAQSTGKTEGRGWAGWTCLESSSHPQLQNRCTYGSSSALLPSSSQLNTRHLPPGTLPVEGPHAQWSSVSTVQVQRF